MSNGDDLQAHLHHTRIHARAALIEEITKKLDAESIAHQVRGQIAVRQWARAWIIENFASDNAGS